MKHVKHVRYDQTSIIRSLGALPPVRKDRLSPRDNDPGDVEVCWDFGGGPSHIARLRKREKDFWSETTRCEDFREAQARRPL